jgi:hypothetical protein
MSLSWYLSRDETGSARNGLTTPAFLNRLATATSTCEVVAAAVLANKLRRKYCGTPSQDGKSAKSKTAKLMSRNGAPRFPDF